MADVSADVLKKLEEAQAQLGAGGGSGVSGPPVSTEAVSLQPAVQVGAAGSGTANYVLVDHYTTSATRYFWAYVGGTWRNHTIATTDEAGIAKIAFEANRVDVWWDANNQLTTVRCWKNL